MILIYLLATYSLVSGERSCSISLPSTDERSCDYGDSKSDNGVSESDYVPPQRSESRYSFTNNDVSQTEYDLALNDAFNKRYAKAVPVLRQAAKTWENEYAYVNLCALLLEYGHIHDMGEAEQLYNEAEVSCNMALTLNADNSDAVDNLEVIRLSREMRGFTVEPVEQKTTAGRFVGVRKKKTKKKRRSRSENVKKEGQMGSWADYAALAESLRIYPGEMDDGTLEFKLYNGSSIDPRLVMLQRGEVYVEDDFLSESERRVLITVIERGLPHKDGSGDKGPVGAVLSGTLLSIGSQLSKEERLLFARLRERVVNRANDFRGLDSSMYSFARGVRAHATALLRYTKNGKHNVHHDNDFLNRCLSASIVLSDGFEGGEFNLHTTKNAKEVNLEGFPIIGTVKGRIGRLSLFLSQSMHSVSELVSGTRDAFFVWMTCDAEAEYQLDDPLVPVDERKVWVTSV